MGFRELWGRYATFTFSDFVPAAASEYDACFIGGGSFLDQPIKNIDTVKCPIAFIGVGIHGEVHEKNQAALARARIVLCRNNHKTYTRCPDLVMARTLWWPREPEREKILVLGNGFLLPEREHPGWRHAAFDWFAKELASLLDGYLQLGFEVEFYPMQSAEPPGLLKYDDRPFGFAVASQMSKREKVKIEVGVADEGELVSKIHESKLVVSMRFHGNIFATMAGKPFVCVTSHDKMKAFENSVDYYGFTKKAFGTVKTPNRDQLLEIADREKKRWQSLSAIVGEKFGM